MWAILRIEIVREVGRGRKEGEQGGECE